MQESKNSVRRLLLDGDRLGDYQKLTLKGKLIYPTIHEAKKSMDEILEDAQGYIVNMYEVVQIDSTGFGFLINLGKKLYQNNKEMVIMIKDDMIKELFDISKINQVFPVVETIEEAMSIFRENKEELPIKLEEY